MGAGARGNVYGDYSITYPGRLQIIGVAEPIAERNNRYCQKHSIDEKIVLNLGSRYLPDQNLRMLSLLQRRMICIMHLV